MKKTISFIIAALFSIVMWADKQGGTISSSTGVPLSPTETITLTYDGTGTNFANWEPKCHIYARLDAKNGKELSKEYTTGWAACDGDDEYAALPAKVMMTFVSKGIYSISMNIKSFFGVADNDLEKIGQLCIVVRAQYEGDDNQTNDMFINVGTYYMKNNWDGGDWTWREMTKDGENYKLENVVFGVKPVFELGFATYQLFHVG